MGVAIFSRFPVLLKVKRFAQRYSLYVFMLDLLFALGFVCMAIFCKRVPEEKIRASTHDLCRIVWRHSVETIRIKCEFLV